MTKTRDYRPKIHFSPETGWMNDPNGMVYVDGVYLYASDGKAVFRNIKIFRA